MISAKSIDCSCFLNFLLNFLLNSHSGYDMSTQIQVGKLKHGQIIFSNAVETNLYLILKSVFLFFIALL